MPCVKSLPVINTASFVGARKMTVPPGKTPISFLQEISTKRGITPQYDLIANEGAVHEPVFIMRVTVGDIIATGKGTSKKKAKHGAAHAALKQILGLPNGEQEAVPVDSNQQSQALEGDVPGNPVGELQEFTQKKLIKPPIYEFANEQGPPHKREFVCVVKLGKFTEKGTGRSKKAAKRKAASLMLHQIQNIIQDGNDTTQIEESDDDDEIPLHGKPIMSDKKTMFCAPVEVTVDGKLSKAIVYNKLRKLSTDNTWRNFFESLLDEIIMTQEEKFSPDEKQKGVSVIVSADTLNASELRASYTALKELKVKIPIPNAQQNKELQQFYQKIRGNKKLKNTNLSAPATNYCQMLQEIAEVQRFEVSYLDIAEVSISGQRQCLVQLSTMPIAVCHGTGPTVDDAHAQAAYSALEYLRLMTKT